MCKYSNSIFHCRSEHGTVQDPYLKVLVGRRTDGSANTGGEENLCVATTKRRLCPPKGGHFRSMKIACEMLHVWYTALSINVLVFALLLNPSPNLRMFFHTKVCRSPPRWSSEQLSDRLLQHPTHVSVTMTPSSVLPPLRGSIHLFQPETTRDWLRTLHSNFRQNWFSKWHKYTSRLVDASWMDIDETMDNIDGDPLKVHPLSYLVPIHLPCWS